MCIRDSGYSYTTVPLGIIMVDDVIITVSTRESTTVSYTHLDVYKRQIFSCMPLELRKFMMSSRVQKH